MSWSSTDYRFTFAAWAAATAARSSPKARFQSVHGVAALKETNGLFRLALSKDNLPVAHEFDGWHRQVTDEVQHKLRKAVSPDISFGVAAKLINVYVKALFLRDFDDHSNPILQEKLAAVHPPVDRLLLTALITNFKTDPKMSGRVSAWRALNNTGWSSFTACQYYDAIESFRDLNSDGLWEIERFWPGHQPVNLERVTS